MFKQFVRWSAIVLIVLLVNGGPVQAQFGIGKKKDEPRPPMGSDKAPELSEGDKKKMAEIEQRPEVINEIRLRWDAQRRADLEFAYEVNSSTRLGDLSGPQFADFREKYGQLYDNPMLQRYLNDIGQHLVPRDSPNTYAFKLLLDPVPRAEALSTGTVFISTGMISLLDNEAQLAYVLGHEVAHVERNHRYNQIKNEVLEQELNEERERSTEKKRTIFSAVAAGVGAATGAGVGGGRGAVLGTGIGLLGGVVASQFIFRTKATTTEWPAVYENEADEAGLKYMLDRNYDVREIPSVYARLDKMVTRDARVSLGFMGQPARIKERVANIHGLLGDSLKASIEVKLKAGGLIGSTPNFPVLMSALKRDNGIIALDYDLFAMAKDNLEEAVSLRSNDALAQSYLGKTIALTARTEEDYGQASDHFLKAIQYDAERGAYPESRLEQAILLISKENPADEQEIDKELRAFVKLYQREHAGKLPQNMRIIYDYLTLAGDNVWYVPPAAEVATRYGDSLSVSSSGQANAPGVREIVEKSTERHATQPAETAQPTQPRKRNVSTTPVATHP
ncbi:MAG: M48 family metalloprotease [Candidatus Acidiferrum sp.]